MFIANMENCNVNLLTQISPDVWIFTTPLSTPTSTITLKCPGKATAFHYYKETCAHFEDTYSLQCHFITLPSTPKVSNFTLGHQHFLKYGKPSYGKCFSITFSHMATPQG